MRGKNPTFLWRRSMKRLNAAEKAFFLAQDGGHAASFWATPAVALKQSFSTFEYVDTWKNKHLSSLWTSTAAELNLVWHNIRRKTSSSVIGGTPFTITKDVSIVNFLTVVAVKALFVYRPSQDPLGCVISIGKALTEFYLRWWEIWPYYSAGFELYYGRLFIVSARLPLWAAPGLQGQRINRLVEVYKPFLYPPSNLFDLRAKLFGLWMLFEELLGSTS